MPTRTALTLHERRKHVLSIEFVNPCPDDWVPTPDHCHENAAAWVKRFPSWTVVRGWLLVSEQNVLGTMFDAHSVVRDSGGHLWDVTQDDEHRLTKGIDGYASWSVLPLRLTSRGHDFAEAVSEKTVWEKVTKELPGAAMSSLVMVSVGLLQAYAKKKLGLN